MKNLFNAINYRTIFLFLSVCIIISCSEKVEWTDETLSMCISNMTKHNKSRLTGEVDEKKLQIVEEMAVFTCNNWQSKCLSSPSGRECKKAIKYLNDI